MAQPWLLSIGVVSLLVHCRGATNLPPTFTMAMDNLALSETTPVGSVVYTLEGKDPEDLPVKYDLVGTDKFSVDRDSGEVTLVKPLDRETEDTLKFLVSIEDEVPGSTNNKVIVPVTVIVLDENDNPPMFKNSPYEVNVAEDEEIGMTILDNIQVEDRDTVGDNLEVTCVADAQWPDACEIFELVAINSTANQYNGALVLRRKLDYNEKQYYQFKLSATDGSLSSTSTVEVPVSDVQNIPPQFRGSLAAGVAEDVKVGSTVLKISARDGDRARPREVAIEMINNPHDFFILDPATGELKTAKPLDREALSDPSSPLNITVKATELENGHPVSDPNAISFATLSISILDANDCAPEWDAAEYHVLVPESLPVHTPLPGLEMMVLDRDLGINSVFGIRLLDKQGLFVVEPTTGAGSARVTLRLNSSLDYEDPNQRKFILEVIAEELHTSPRLSSKSNVIVTVTDVNDNAPTFREDGYSFTANEGSRAGDVLGTVIAGDGDSGRFGTDGIIYQLSGNGAELFSVDNRTGVISVAACPSPGLQPCLDFEARKDYFLHYKATDDDGTGQSTVVSLHIILEDDNDNPPVFTTGVYRASIDEDAVKFEPELQVQARDLDVSSEIRYSITDPISSPFWIDPVSGKIGVKPDSAVQMETDDNHVVLTVMASDGIHNATCLVEITIRDVNNHAPAFETQHYVANVSEDTSIGTEISQVRASDMDSGVNSEIRYAIQKGALESFIINNMTGIVTVAAPLDYDKRDVYRIQIVANDLGMPSLTGTTELTVQVINVNDKKPYFTPAIQRAEVTADAEPGTIVHNLTAVDPDIINNAMLQYSLNTEKQIKAVDRNGKEVSEQGIFTPWFSVSSRGVVSVSSPPDRSRAAVLTLPVRVEDSTASMKQISDGELIITIVDVNRHAPHFPQSTYFLTIPEEQPTGTELATFTATDEDSAIAAILIEPANPYFHIDNSTGQVKIAQRIDYEKIQSINFTITAYDTGVPSRSSSADVIVLITNINDEQPKFITDLYEASVVENSEVGTPVVTLQAKDGDLGPFGEIRYSISGNLSSLFALDPITGEVTVLGSLDREVVTDVWLRAKAEDNAPESVRKSDSVPIHIKIIDVNDNAPLFTQKVYKSSISDNLRTDPPPAILQVLAEDRDEGGNGNVEYMITEQSEDDTFTVDKTTGIIYPLKAVSENRTYHLTVIASDGPHFDTAKVDIFVLSVNKHTPVFVQPSASQHFIEVFENAAKADYLITTIKATDEDSGENGRVSYFLKVNNTNVADTPEFVLDQNSGELRTKTFLDREHSAQYQLVLVASDNGTPAKFETLHFLTIILKDANDNIPQFPKDLYEFNILENQPAGIIVGSVKAIDKDTGDHARVYYHILEGNTEGALVLDRTQGLLRANISFDRELQSEYSLIVYASNNPILERAAAILNSIDNATEEVKHRSIANIKVRVLDENDNAPQFENAVYYAAVKHTARINEPILPILATDPDLEENGTLSYLVAASNLYKFGSNQSSGSIVPSPFNISQEGLLMTSTYMAEYNQDRFVLDIIAQELAPPHRQAKTQVYVWVMDRSSQLRCVISRKCEEARQITSLLGDRTNTRILSARHSIYVHGDTAYNDWCEMHLHAVDPKTLEIIPVEKVLESIDSKYDELKDFYQQYGVETLMAASASSKVPDSFDPALAALIALLIVLFTGIVTFVVVCACLKHWVIPPPSLQSSKGDSLARRRILEELSTTENPLWLETKLRPYEEQELTMNVFGDQNEQTTEQTQTDNTYATIQGSRTTERFGDYATLGGESPTPLEAALGFQGSTFKPPSSDTPEPPPRPSAGLSQLTW